MANLSPVPPLLQESRFPFELRALRRSAVWRGDGIPHGSGEPVLLLPGFMAGDSSLSFMANWLKRVGYAPRRAGIRANIDCSEKAVRALERRIEMIVSETDEPMRLIGHSRGGMFARVLAVRRPDLIAGVITLGTPHLATMGDLHPVLQGQINALCRLGNLGLGVLSGRCRAGAPGQAGEQRLLRGVLGRPGRRLPAPRARSPRSTRAPTASSTGRPASIRAPARSRSPPRTAGWACTPRSTMVLAS